MTLFGSIRNLGDECLYEVRLTNRQADIVKRIMSEFKHLNETKKIDTGYEYPIDD